LRPAFQGGPSATCRRFWNGAYFSQPVHTFFSDEEADYAMRTKSVIDPARIIWSGLASPHPGRYPYRLYATGTNLDPLKER
jgi:hypothetical protein